MDRPCGCGSYDECWAGDCCCFTLSEKLAWARANNITPPREAVEKAARSTHSAAKPACPHCEKAVETAKINVVLVAFAQKCKGQTLAGLSLLPVAVPPPTATEFAVELSFYSRLPLLDRVATVRPSAPDAPPPRS